jgi:hypothetical protein
MLAGLLSEAYASSGSTSGQSSPSGLNSPSLSGMTASASEASAFGSDQTTSEEGGTWQWLVGNVSYAAQRVDQAAGVAGNLLLTGTLVSMESTSGLDLLGAAGNGLATGGKAVVNGAATAARSTVTLGIVGDHWEVIPVSEADQANGYGLSAGLAQVGFDVLITVGSGGLASALAKGGKVARTASGALLLYDAAGNYMGVVRGAEDMAANGPTRANVIQVVAGGIGLAASPVPKAAAGAAWDAAKRSSRGSTAFMGVDPSEFANDFGKRLVGPGGPRNATARESLLGELAQQGVKHTPESIVAIGKNASGKVVFLEKGTAQAGLQHIVDRHAADFAARGITVAQIPEAVMMAATEGKVVGTVGSGRNTRTIYEIEFKGVTQRIAVGEASNGFIVTAHPAN